jgi:DNA mismatch repair ATPase MutS
MLARRNAERQAAGQRKAMVVAREQVAVLTRATLMDPEMLASNPEASYLLASAYPTIR